ncbi:hypothetical protein JYU29_04990 [Tianweitania sp. BSSL-BM11]|uniref:Uncharacterized protein n=1 Tax=Tianweitania aestuarii TaxID=2814886 RepID=A0ABS5RSM1_9HYPH|nr:hypothetical protein [Tianweitania aestuarii]MBS9720043.1 hypothetical protein [Tianweitania aestuarii]
MNGPTDFGRQLQSIEAMLAAPSTWDGLEHAFKPSQMPDRFDPGDDIKMLLAGLKNTVDGRRIIEWLADLTFRAPYPSTGSSFEQAALAAAKHEARAAVGHVLLRAIAEGDALLNQRSQRHETPA